MHFKRRVLKFKSRKNAVSVDLKVMDDISSSFFIEDIIVIEILPTG